MASGKTTIARALAKRLDQSVHLRGDVFRTMIVNGAAVMGPVLSSSARAQLRLRQELACAAARRYLAAGFDVVYEDILLGEDLVTVAERLADLEPQIVVLVADADTLTRRDTARRTTGRSEQGYGPAFPAHILAEAVANDTPRLGLWLDTTEITVDMAVDRVLTHVDDQKGD